MVISGEQGTGFGWNATEAMLGLPRVCGVESQDSREFVERTGKKQASTSAFLQTWCFSFGAVDTSDELLVLKTPLSALSSPSWDKIVKEDGLDPLCRLFFVSASP